MDKEKKRQINNAIALIRSYCLEQLCSTCALNGNLCRGAENKRENDTSPYMWQKIK